MKKSPSSKTVSFSVSQEISGNLGNPIVRPRAHNSSPPVPILNHITLVHVLPKYLGKIHFSIILL